MAARIRAFCLKAAKLPQQGGSGHNICHVIDLAQVSVPPSLITFIPTCYNLATVGQFCGGMAAQGLTPLVIR